MAKQTRTGGREATDAVIPGRIALSVGRPSLPEPPGFKWRMLSDVARLESGHTPSRSKKEYWNGDIPWLGIRDATGNHGKILHKTLDYISQDGLSNSSARLLPAGTVCLSRTASVGFVVEMGRPMATSQDFVNWICGPELSNRYLRYLLMLEQDSVRRFSHGTTHQTMYYPEAKALNVLIPDIVVQNAIADVLEALDQKIAGNELVSAKADELASVKWTLACEDGFAVPLSSLARFVNGKAFTKDASGAGRVVIRIAELNSGIGASTVYNNIEVPDENLARPGDLLFAWSGSLTVARWFRGEAIVNQHIFKVIPTGDHPIWLINQALRDKLQEFKAIAADKATTMGHIQRRHLDEPVTIPAPGQVDRFDGQMSALWERALAAEQENLQLESTRDQLLPLLMSGKVRVREAEKIVEGVV